MADDDRPSGSLDPTRSGSGSSGEHRVPAEFDRLGDFEPLRELGRGGMGVVYEARQISLNRRVALKVLPPGLGLSKNAVQRFEREARAAAKLRHPNIVPVHAIGEDRGCHFYAMELIEGSSLAGALDGLRAGKSDAPLSVALTRGEAEEPDETTSQADPVTDSSSLSDASSTNRGWFQNVARMLAEVADALHYAHGRGVIHRDIKPGNLMLTPDERLCVTDFGLALVAQEPGTTMSGSLLGSPAYMSPEQVTAGRMKLDHRTDVYSLGTVLYEVLTLQRPFPGTAREEVLTAIIAKEPTRPRKLNGRIPPDLETVCLKAMEKDPDRRYATAGEMAADLRRFLEGGLIAARRAGLLRRSAKLISRRPAASGAVFLSVAALLVGGWSWDAYFRVKVGHYNALVKRRGIPEGITRLSRAEAKRHDIAYKFRRRGGVVESVEVVNGWGQPNNNTPRWLLAAPIESPDDYQSWRPEVRYEYRYDEGGRLAEETAFDRYGQVAWRFHYTSPDTGHYTDDRGFPLAHVGSGAAYVRFVWSPQGFEQEVRYLDANGNPKPDDSGLYGQRFERNVQGLIVERTHLGADNSPAIRKGAGTAIIRLRFDGHGSLRGVRFFGVDGRPVLNKDGCHEGLKRTDEHDRVVEWTCLGFDDQPVLSKERDHRQRNKYDERGDLIEAAHFDIEGHPTLHKNRFHKRVQEYDDRGNVVDRTFFGTDGRPVLNKYGVHRHVMQYDGPGNQVEMAYFGVSGEPVFSDERWHRRKRSYDAKGNLIDMAYFGSDGEPVLNTGGLHRKTQRYDERGNRVEWAHFGVAGEPILYKSGNHKSTSKFNVRGNEIERAYFGTDGSPVALREGCHRKTYSYNDLGERIEWACFDVNDQPTRTRTGFHRHVEAYDSRGNRISRAFFDVDGRPIKRANGHHERVWTYDARNQNVGWAYFDAEGNPVAHKDGYHRAVQEFDDRGLLVAYAYFGTDGEPVLRGDYHRAEVKFDERRRATERAYSGVDGKPTLLDEGWHRVAWQSDARGNETIRELFGIDGRLVVTDDGWARMTREYDDRDNQVAWAVFGANGQAVLNEEGLHRVESKFDDRANWIEGRAIGVDGEPILYADEFHRAIASYDGRGNQIEFVVFGLNGEPVLHRNGYFRQTFRYDERDEAIDAAYFDIGGEPLTVDVVVKKVQKRGQAADLGLEKGDVLIAYAGEELANEYRFWTRLGEQPEGEPDEELIVRRGDKTLSFALEAGELGATLEDRVRNQAQAGRKATDNRR